MKNTLSLLSGALVFIFFGSNTFAQTKAASQPKAEAVSNHDWPQWRGPNRDGISSETGLLKTWPADGPKVLWRAGSGEGYAGIVVAKGRLVTSYGVGNNEVVVALDANTGKELWRTVLDELFYNDQGNGPRSSPLIEGDWVFALSGQGHLVALRASDGKKMWEHDLATEYGARTPRWGVSTTPLLEGNMLIVDVGGKAGHSVMAFNQTNGAVVWKTGTDMPGYSAPIAITFNGARKILAFTGSALVGLAANDGNLLWQYPWETQFDVNAATPIFIAPDKVFIASGYGQGSALLQLQTNNGKDGVREVWKSREMRNHFSSSILHQNFLYGFDESFLTCLDVATGKPRWQQRGFNKGSLLFADGHLIVLGERGNLALVEATPAAYQEKASVQILNGKCWTMPTLAQGKLYVRNQNEILCVDANGKN